MSIQINEEIVVGAGEGGGGGGGGDALTADPLSQFADTTSAQLASVITDPLGSGQAVFSDKPLAAQSLRTVEVFTEADMGTPVGGIVTLVAGTTYIIMSNVVFFSNRYDFASSEILTPIIITANQKFSNVVLDTGSNTSLFFNSDPTTPSSLEIRNVSFFKNTGASGSFIDYQSDAQLDGLVQILGSDIINFLSNSSVFNNVQVVFGEGTRWLESSPIELIDAQFVLSDSLVGGNFPEDITTPELIISSSGDPLKLTQIGLNSAIIGSKAMRVHSNLVPGSAVTIHNTGKLPGATVVTNFFLGTSGTVTAVTDGGGGKIECATAGHDVFEGDTISHSNNFSDINYRGEFIASEVVPGVSYKVVAVFGSTDTGTWTNLSLTQKDPRVISTLNEKIGLTNSMTVSSIRSTKLFVVNGAQGVFVPIVDSVAPQSGDFVVDVEERITTDDQTGLATHNGLVDIDVEVKYSFDFVHSTGSAQDLEFAITQNGTVIPSSILTFNSGDVNTLATIGTILRLAPGEAVGLVRNNTSGSIDTDISNIRRLITSAG